jgi:enoyl-CoA hydratase
MLFAHAPIETGGPQVTEDYETIRATREADGIELVVLNRPLAANALNTQMGLDLVVFFEALAMRPDRARCILLTGAGTKAFCAGGDLKERNGMSVEAWSNQHRIFERMIRAIVDCPVPVIAAVNGAAYGGGCEIALACDFIHAAESARFSLPEVGLGIMPGGGGTQTLTRAVGERKSKELIFTSRPFNAEEALAWGLVNAAHPDEALLSEAMKLAGVIAAKAPLAIRQAKQAIHRGLQMSLADGLAFEIEAYNRLPPTEDRVEGVRAFNEKRRPQFNGR